MAAVIIGSWSLSWSRSGSGSRSVALANKIAEALGQPVSRYVLSAHAARPKLPKKLKAGRYQRTKTKGA